MSVMGIDEVVSSHRVFATRTVGVFARNLPLGNRNFSGRMLFTMSAAVMAAMNVVLIAPEVRLGDDSFTEPEPAFQEEASSSRPSVAPAQQAPAVVRLGLDDASLEHAWTGALDLLRRRGDDPTAVVLIAARNLDAWRDAPRAEPLVEPLLDCDDDV